MCLHYGQTLINKCGIAEAPMDAPHVELMRFGFSRTSARAGQTASRFDLSEFSLRENSRNCGLPRDRPPVSRHD
jgi:hypothetical protein